MKSIKNYTELSDEQLSKLNGKRLLGLKNKMNKIIGVIRTFDDDEQKVKLPIAIKYKERIMSKLTGFGNIEK